MYSKRSWTSLLLDKNTYFMTVCAPYGCRRLPVCDVWNTWYCRRTAELSTAKAPTDVFLFPCSLWNQKISRCVCLVSLTSVMNFYWHDYCSVLHISSSTLWEKICLWWSLMSIRSTWIADVPWWLYNEIYRVTIPIDYRQCDIDKSFYVYW